MASRDRIRLPVDMKTDRASPILSVYKENQAIHVLFRQRDADGILKATASGSGIAVMTLYGELATIRLKRHHPDPSGLLELS
jgi:hypothetical protein